jgi:hypothetical protein
MALKIGKAGEDAVGAGADGPAPDQCVKKNAAPTYVASTLAGAAGEPTGANPPQAGQSTGLRRRTGCIVLRR